MLFDIHCHTTISDGENEPESIASIVGENDIWTVTDHNNIGYHEKYQAPLTGVELSADVFVDGRKQAIEILVYNFNMTPNIIKLTNEIRDYAADIQHRNLIKLIDIVKSLGCTVSPNVVLDESGFSHRSLYFDLIKYPNNKEILGDFLNSGENFYHYGQREGSPIYIEFNNNPYSFEDVCKVYRDYGARIFLAHPHYYGKIDTKNLLVTVSKHVTGIECLHPSANEQQSKDLLNFCKDNNLLASGGSDFHKGEYVGTPNFHLVEMNKDLFNWIKFYRNL